MPELFDAQSTVDEYLKISGIQECVLFQILESSIEKTYQRKGMIVSCHIYREGDKFVTNAIKMFPDSDRIVNWEKLDFVIQPDSLLIREAVEQYLSGISKWNIDWMEVVEIIPDEFIFLRNKNNQTAVLPFSRLGGSYRGFDPHQKRHGFVSFIRPEDFSPGLSDTLLVAYRPIPKNEFHDGVESYLQSGADFLATRVDSIFLRLAAQKFLRATTPQLQQTINHLQTEIFSGTGIVLVPFGMNFDGLVGPGGEQMRILKFVTGLRKVTMVLLPDPSKPIRYQIGFLLRQLTGVKAKIPKVPSTDRGVTYWPIPVTNQDLGRVLGDRCCNAAFLQRITRETVLIQSR